MTARVRLLVRPYLGATSWNVSGGLLDSVPDGPPVPSGWPPSGFSGFEIANDLKAVWVPYSEDTAALSLRLLESGESVLGARLYRQMRAILTEPAPAPPPTSPEFEQGRWDNDPHTNCYGYATDRGGWVEPGGESQARWTMEILRRMLEKDGLVAWDQASGTLAAGHFVAAFLSELHDYHFCRLNRDGSWSEKAGAEPACKLAGHIALLTDPRVSYVGTAEFCGFFHAGPRG